MVVYLDEKKFNLFGSEGIQWCRTGPGEEFKEQNIKQEVSHRGGSVMVWGCMMSRGYRRLCLVKEKMDAVQYVSILENGLMGTLQDQNLTPSEVLFQQDNDLKNKFYLAINWLHDHGFKILDWPACSPDINIMENAWAQLAAHITYRSPRPSNETQLFAALQEEWAKMEEEYRVYLYESVPHRLGMLELAKGKWNKY